MPLRLKKSAPVSQLIQKLHPSRNHISQRENPMTEMKKLVTADAVKSALRTEEVRGTLKASIRKTFEDQIDADVEAILDELIGPAEGASVQQAGDGENTADSPVENSSEQPEAQPGGEEQPADVLQPEPATML
ncbi:DUF826 domain-containing protein [Escherichia coli]|nr:DUF826 domain-containing protein [Escherichia coli]